MCDSLFSDVQSDNILILYKSLNTIKSLHIADFGTAKELTQATGTLVGTPGFIAPEVLIFYSKFTKHH